MVVAHLQDGAASEYEQTFGSSREEGSFELGEGSGEHRGHGERGVVLDRLRASELIG